MHFFYIWEKTKTAATKQSRMAKLKNVKPKYFHLVQAQSSRLGFRSASMPSTEWVAGWCRSGCRPGPLVESPLPSSMSSDGRSSETRCRWTETIISYSIVASFFKKNWASFFFIFAFSSVNRYVHYKILPMTGFEPRKQVCKCLTFPFSTNIRLHVHSI